MTELQDIFAEYTRMRKNGLDSKVALHALRGYIEPLVKSQREQLAQLLRAWEAGETNTPLPRSRRPTGEVPKPGGPIKPLAPPAGDSASPVIRSVNIPHTPPASENVDLGELQGRFDTHTLVDETTRVSEDFFGVTSVMVLLVRGTNQAFEVRPQQYDHEIIIGRSSEQSAMHPDIDLQAFQGAEMGVSRLHMALRYDNDHNAIHIYDLGSSNGSYLNNQRLNPHEVRFLRDGDQLRLGRMVIGVRFKHPGR
ncbi:MAG: FHA domain-containing protein [Chloroflexi bacterium]|nr:FHA domain-containing protein [Chloroflexota bacterium]